MNSPPRMTSSHPFVEAAREHARGYRTYAELLDARANVADTFVRALAGIGLPPDVCAPRPPNSVDLLRWEWHRFREKQSFSDHTWIEVRFRNGVDLSWQKITTAYFGADESGHIVPGPDGAISLSPRFTFLALGCALGQGDFDAVSRDALGLRGRP